MVNIQVAVAIDELTASQRKLFFGAKIDASSRDERIYRRIAPLNLIYDADQSWHLHKYSLVKDRFAFLALTRIVKAKATDQPIPIEEQIESDAPWARFVHIELIPHPGIANPKAIEADFMMANGVLALDMRAPLVGYALRRWSVDCSPKHSLDPKEHHLWLRNSQTLYGVESATLAPGYSNIEIHLKKPNTL